MNDLSVLIGGKAGYGIDKAGSMIASVLGRLNYRIYIYRDYPSIIRGGHTFSIIRASEEKVISHKDKVDFILAMDQATADIHRTRLNSNSVMIYDSDSVKADPSLKDRAIPISLGTIIKELGAPEIMRNSAIVGALCRAVGAEWDLTEEVFKSDVSKELEINLKVARCGYDGSKEVLKLNRLDQEGLPLYTGNEALALGLIKSGLKSYIAYPMTPVSAILHFMASAAEKDSLKVIHPENEIAVMMMATGFAYCGEKVAVGTSGGGFCLMTEGLSFSAMAELPVVIILGQRPGPSTGLPTYSCQTELHFALNAGQGEFPRFTVAPGDPEEAYYWAQVAMNISWKYQVPSIILSDKTLGEGTYSFDIKAAKAVGIESPLLWDGKAQYKRYLNTENGVSPLALPPRKEAVIKINSYEHDESGITTEDPNTTVMMQDKRLRKEKYIGEYLESYETVKVLGDVNSPTAILCWGSTKGVCEEAAKRLGLRVIQPLAMSPFPVKKFKEALKGVKRTILVENSATGQLLKLISGYGINIDKNIYKYDGRPFSADELELKLKEVVK